jgi:hypothetical protein
MGDGESVAGNPDLGPDLDPVFKGTRRAASLRESPASDSPSILRILSQPLIFAFSGIFGLIFTISGIREPVIRRNFAIIGASGALKRPRFFRLRLGVALARDLLDLVAPGPLPTPRLHPRSARHAAALASGPSLLLTAHYGNWEAQAAAWRARGVPLLGAARPVRSQRVGAWVDALRARHAVSVIHAGVPRAALRHLRAGGCFGLLWDQHSPAGMQDGRIGTFFGAPVALDPLPFFLLARNPCPVYFGVLLPDGVLRLIPLLDASQALKDGWEARLARRYHRVLEALIRARPARWHGVLHARFKALGAYPGHRDGVG